MILILHLFLASDIDRQLFHLFEILLLALSKSNYPSYHETSLPRLPRCIADPGRPLIPANDTRTAGGCGGGGGGGRVVPPPLDPLSTDDLTLWSAAEVTEGGTALALLKAFRRLDQLLPIEFLDVRRWS